MLRRLSFCVLAVTAFGCNCGQPPSGQDAGPTCVDKDGDGSDSCSDCNDNDAAIAPGKAEVCDAKDNDCNGKVDDSPACECVPGSQPKTCGKNSSCQQTCGADGKLQTCLPPGATTVDLQTDPANCGVCGNACPAPVNSSAACKKGVCTRGPCKTGFFDIDGAKTFGCESTCTGRVCTDPQGASVTLSNDPLPEAGAVFQVPSSGGSFGDKLQTSASHTNFGVLGEPTPPGAGGAVESKNDVYRHFGGFTASKR
ncbi:MAG: putative metal-binding motif-containing protein [Myxococcales bacterium]|nr:putative metal-binding motif-containing protein [Myxococcales bacterium]